MNKHNILLYSVIDLELNLSITSVGFKSGSKHDIAIAIALGNLYSIAQNDLWQVANF